MWFSLWPMCSLPPPSSLVSHRGERDGEGGGGDRGEGEGSIVDPSKRGQPQFHFP